MDIALVAARSNYATPQPPSMQEEVAIAVVDIASNAIRQWLFMPLGTAEVRQDVPALVALDDSHALLAMAEDENVSTGQPTSIKCAIITVSGGVAVLGTPTSIPITTATADMGSSKKYYAIAESTTSYIVPLDPVVLRVDIGLGTITKVFELTKVSGDAPPGMSWNHYVIGSVQYGADYLAGHSGATFLQDVWNGTGFDRTDLFDSGSGLHDSAIPYLDTGLGTPAYYQGRLWFLDYFDGTDSSVSVHDNPYVPAAFAPYGEGPNSGDWCISSITLDGGTRGPMSFVDYVDSREIQGNAYLLVAGPLLGVFQATGRYIDANGVPQGEAFQMLTWNTFTVNADYTCDRGSRLVVAQSNSTDFGQGGDWQTFAACTLGGSADVAFFYEDYTSNVSAHIYMRSLIGGVLQAPLPIFTDTTVGGDGTTFNGWYGGAYVVLGAAKSNLAGVYRDKRANFTRAW